MSMKIHWKIKRALILGGVAGGILGMLLTFAAASKALDKKEASMAATKKTWTAEKKKLEGQLEKKKTVEAAATLSTEEPDDWALILVNGDHPLDQKYTPDLAEVATGFSVDSRIAEDAKNMLSDATQAGLSMHICSAYRSYEEQKTVFNETMQTWVDQGNSYVDAYTETSKSVAVPGYSEHATGLAMDITSEGYQELDEKQAETAEAKWLAENCYKYGFILRYPSDKSDITGIVYEPWHYRYVGKEVAKEIKEQGVTLEEYLGVA